ncbi:MAG: hypothetical protein ABI852_14765 [Gemmatimonadaceae bacterium]
MRRKFLCGLAAALWGPVLLAQPVPARDLWQFPLGAVLEPAAIATEAGSGMWNPASVAMPADTRLRVGVGSLLLSANQGVDGQLIGAAWRRASGVTFGLSVARAEVSGLIATDDNPQQVGTLTYNSTLISGTVAKRIVPHLTLGIAARYREGRTDLAVRSAIAADMGMIVDSLTKHSVRIALSSFLWRPGQERDDQPVFLSAIDARVLANPKAPDIRLGYSRTSVNGGARENGPFASVRYGPIEGRGALVITKAYGERDLRARSGLALHYQRFVVGIGREEGVGGLGPLYQFTLSSIVK